MICKHLEFFIFKPGFLSVISRCSQLHSMVGLTFLFDSSKPLLTSSNYQPMMIEATLLIRLANQRNKSWNEMWEIYMCVACTLHNMGNMKGLSWHYIPTLTLLSFTNSGSSTPSLPIQSNETSACALCTEQSNPQLLHPVMHWSRDTTLHKKCIFVQIIRFHQRWSKESKVMRRATEDMKAGLPRVAPIVPPCVWVRW